MRHSLGADIKKLPLSDVRDLANDLWRGFVIGREIYEKHPWIKEYSQDVVREIYGDHFPAWNFETLGIFAEPWDAPIKMVTTNPQRMWSEMQDHNTFQWGLTNKTVVQEQIVMRYELTPERVLVYVPALIQAVMDMFGDSLHRWKADGGASFYRVFARSLYEHEDEKIVADLNGLTPAVMDFRIGKKQYRFPPQKHYVAPGVLEWRPAEEPEPDLGERPGEIWWWDKRLVRDIIAEWGDKGPDAFALDLIKSNQIAIDEEWTQEKVVEFFREIYRKIGAFYSP